MNHFKINSTTIIIALIALGIVSAICYFLIWPMYGNIQNEKQAIGDKNNELSFMDDKLADLKNLESNLNALPLSTTSSQSVVDDYVSTAKTLIPEEPALGDFLIQLEAMLGQAGLSKANYSVVGLSQGASNQPSAQATTPTKKSSVTTDAQTHQFSISAEAPYVKIGTLLSTLKIMNRLTEINSLNLTTNTSDNLSFQIGGNIFSKPTVSTQMTKTDQASIQSIYDYFSQIKSYGRLIDIDKETGFGRSNPFLPY